MLMVINLKLAKIMAGTLAIVFFMIHLMMYIIFTICKVTPLAVFNEFSMIFYVAMVWVAYNGWLNTYAPLVLMEVIMHMFLAVILTGWNNSFQFTMIGINIIAFYGEYVGRTLKIEYTRMLPYSLLSMILYLISYFWTSKHEVKYILPEWAVRTFNITWGVVVFGIVIFVMQLFVLIVDNSQKKLEYQMAHDKLTDLPNRYYFSKYIEEIEKNNGFNGYWVAIGDIDDFKKINDTYGHNCGDQVLMKVAKMAKEVDCGFCCRWGGEEILFVGQQQNGEKEVFKLLDDFRKKLENYKFEYEEKQFKVTMTIGLSIFEKQMTRDSWISSADEKLYIGKQQNKNQVVT